MGNRLVPPGWDELNRKVSKKNMHLWAKVLMVVGWAVRECTCWQRDIQNR